MARVLLVEHQAGSRSGHFMTRLEALARSISSAGHEVHVLTGNPLAIEAEERTLDDVAVVHVADERWRRVDRWSEWLSNFPPDGPGRRLARPLRGAGEFVRQFITASSVANCARDLGNPQTLVLSLALRADLAVLFAPRTARWTIYEFYGPRGGATAPSSPARLASRLLARREARRRRAGGWIQVVVNSRANQDEWRVLHPWLRSATVRIAGTTDATPEPREAARSALGIDAADRVALVFGVAHADKDLHSVFLAFAGDDAPCRLIAAGKDMQRAMDEVRQRHPHAVFPLVAIFDGPQTDRLKHLLHSAADYAIISTKPGRRLDSGTLADAVSYRLPVLCSDDYVPGEVVEELRLGLRFANGDATSLRETACRMAALVVEPDDRDRFMRSMSDATLGSQLVAVTLDPIIRLG